MTNPIDDITLSRAISHARAIEDPAGEMGSGMAEDSRRAFDMHDAVHVLFGCDTSPRGEIEAHVWMAFATNAPMADMHRAVANREHRKALRGIGHAKLALVWLGMLPRIVGIMLDARRMTLRLPYDRLEDLMDRPIADIRREFGIPAR